MKFEKSCGAVVVTKIDNKIKYLIIKSIEGIYGFPKGHMELDEAEEEETALREILEETGIKVKIIDGFRYKINYEIKDKNIYKEVIYFLGEYSNQEIIYQKEELSDAELMDFSTAFSVLQYDDSKAVLKAANDYLKTYKNMLKLI